MAAQMDLTIDEAEDWREFLRDATREAKMQLARAEKAGAAAPKGTSARKALRREVRERNCTYTTLRKALDSVSMCASKGQTCGAENSNAIEAVYKERAQCVAALARLAQALGHAVGFSEDDERTGWPVLYIELPTGQVSWHFTASDRAEFAPDIQDNPRLRWDGHSTPEKYARLATWTRTLTQIT